MYNNLTSASKQLDLLIEDMKKHPKRYVTFSLLGGRRTVNEPKYINVFLEMPVGCY